MLHGRAMTGWRAAGTWRATPASAVAGDAWAQAGQRRRARSDTRGRGGGQARTSKRWTAGDGRAAAGTRLRARRGFKPRRPGAHKTTPPRQLLRSPWERLATPHSDMERPRNAGPDLG